MAEKLDVPIVGIVENMSYVECPDCGKKIKLYGESHVDETAEKYGLKVLAKLPVDPSIALACDQGLIELFEGDWLDGAAQSLEKLLEEK